MVDKSRLKLIGWLFGAMTGAVMLIAALLVGDAVASNMGGLSAAPLVTFSE